MNGVKPESYYQDGGDEPVYVGTEMRGDGRIMLPPEFQDLLTVLDKKMKHGCRDGCPIPAGAQGAVPHMFGAIAEIGEGSIPNGIDKARDQHKAVKILLGVRKAVKDRVISTLVNALVVGALGLLAYGIMLKVTGG